jgi:hypothetical protein
MQMHFRAVGRSDNPRGRTVSHYILAQFKWNFLGKKWLVWDRNVSLSYDKFVPFFKKSPVIFRRNANFLYRK